jgi:hypothetical protein
MSVVPERYGVHTKHKPSCPEPQKGRGRYFWIFHGAIGEPLQEKSRAQQLKHNVTAFLEEWQLYSSSCETIYPQIRD